MVETTFEPNAAKKLLTLLLLYVPPPAMPVSKLPLPTKKLPAMLAVVVILPVVLMTMALPLAMKLATFELA